MSDVVAGGIAVLAIVFGAVQTAVGGDKSAEVLFDGTSLSAWEFVSRDDTAKMNDVWSIQDGVLICKGKPVGYLRTKKEYSDYVLKLEWRWPAGTKRGNSGVLVHTSTPNAIGIWPKSIEVQLASGNAGDFWVIGTEVEIPNVKQRRKGRRHLNLTDDSEKPFGQWNEMEITCRKDTVIVKVNGELVNECSKASVTKGAICLQSEGAEIHFRNIRLTPIQTADKR